MTEEKSVSRSMKTGISWSLMLLSIGALVLLDAIRAEVSAKSVVSIVRSDNSMLKEPVNPDQLLRTIRRFLA